MHEFKDGRALAAGWVGFPERGGNLVVRELVQASNGELGLKFVPEMIPDSGEPLPLPVTQRKGVVIAKGRILDVCIDNRRTFIARRNDLGGKRLFFFAKGGEVVFEQIEIHPLLEE